MKKRKSSFADENYFAYLGLSQDIEQIHVSDEEFLGDDIKAEGRTPYQEYESLVMKKEQLLKNAGSRRVVYLQHFGDLMAEILETKINCIRLKKTIAYCTKSINLGETIDTKAMQEEIDGEMQAYYVELKSMLEEKEDAKTAKTADDYEVRMTKQIFRRIAKRLHPDINAKTNENAILLDLWNQVMEAYNEFDVEKLEELEVVLNHVMTELGDDGFSVDIDNIEEKIKKLEKKIQEIITTIPYTYGEILSDPKAIELKKQELKKELEEYHIYQLNLEETLEKLTGEGGGRFTWQIIL